MKIANWLSQNTSLLESNNIQTARLDCLVLLEDTLGKNRASILAHLDDLLSSEQLSLLTNKISDRLKHIPLAYIRGHAEFYGRTFMVNDDVLVPRPESETIIDQLKKLPATATIIDVGTGSGALAITAKLEMPDSRVIAVDIDNACLEVTHANAKTLHAQIDTYCGNLIEPIEPEVLYGSTILANLPYVPNSYEVNEAALHEPKLALFGGEDGLALYRKLFSQFSEHQNLPKFVITESLPFQHQDLSFIAKKHGYTLTKTEDFIQVFTV